MVVTKYAYKYAHAVNVSLVMIFFKNVFEKNHGIPNIKFSASFDEMKGSNSCSKKEGKYIDKKIYNAI